MRRAFGKGRDRTLVQLFITTLVLIPYCILHGDFVGLQITGGQLALLTGLLAGTVICLAGRLSDVFAVDKMSIGVIMLLIPGAALTNAVRDMLVGHTISGLLRLAESLLLALMLAIGFGSAIYLFGA